MNNFCFLNINIPLFNESITFDDFPKTNISIIDHKKYLHNNIFELLDSLNLKVHHVETFFKTSGAHKESRIHIDGPLGDYIKLNWVFRSGDSQMCWYSPKIKSNKPILKTKTGTPYILYNRYEVDEIEKTIIQNPTLVQVGIPHNIINITESRLCVSIILHDKDTDQRLTMKESISRFKNYLK